MKEKSVFVNMIKKAILSILGFLQGTIGSYLALLGYFLAFPETEPGMRDYEEDMSTVPFGYMIILIWIIVMVSAFILLRKNKANLLSFIIPWIIGVIGFAIVFFV